MNDAYGCALCMITGKCECPDVAERFGCEDAISMSKNEPEKDDLNDCNLLHCPFCGGEATVEAFHDKRGVEEAYCVYHECPVLGCDIVTEDFWPDAAPAIKAWNTRVTLDGFVTLPATKLESPIFIESDYSSADMSEAIRSYSKYIADKLDYALVTKSLNNAGWFKERTCTVNDVIDNFYIEYHLSCGHMACEDRPNYCPVCGAKVVS